MSVVLPVAVLKTTPSILIRDMAKRQILPLLNLPDSVKQNLDQNLEPYLKAIELDGYDEQTIRKMMVMGNRGILHFLTFSEQKVEQLFMFYFNTIVT